MKIVVVFSGGLDSTCLLARLRADGHALRALSVDYGQRHRRELDAARQIAEALGVDHRVADLAGLRPLFAGSSLTDDAVAVPDGHYADETMKQTIVPNRNMILLAAATAWAVSLKFDAVAYAAHAGDHTIYPDCRPEFADALARAMALCDWRTIELLRPFIALTKGGCLKAASRHLTRDLLALTWSCYKGGEAHCGRCGACHERREAFAEAGIADPTLYA